MSQQLEPGYALPTALRTGPDGDLILYDEQGMAVPKFKVIESVSGQYSRKIDLFAIKMLALLICRDSTKTKALLFLEVVLGPEGLDPNRESFRISGSKLRRAIQLLFYFAEILPKKHQQ